MKHLLLSILLLSSSFVFAQSKDWEQIKTDVKEQVNIKYQSTNGDIFGIMPISMEYVFSTDKGTSWTKIESNISFYFSRNVPFKEDLQQNVYFFNLARIYKFDKQNKKFTEFIVYDENNFISDLDFLPNGNMLVVNNTDLLLYSNNGDLINSRKWMSSSARILMGKDSESKHYIADGDIFPDAIFEFNSDLSFLGNKIDVDVREINRVGNKLIAEGQYSEDGGKTWNEYPEFINTYIQTMTHGANDKLYIATENHIFIVNEGSNDLDSYEHNLGRIRYVSEINDFLIVEIIDGCTNKIFYSINKGVDWNIVVNDIGNYYSYKVNPLIDENIFSRSCNFVQKENLTSDWKEVFIPSENFGDENPNFIHPLSNGNVLASNYFNGIYNSKDKGKTWELLSDATLQMSLSDHSITEKSGKLFHLQFDKLYFSSDFGLNWVTFPIENNLFLLPPYFDFSDEEELYFLDFNSFPVISRYNVKDNSITNLSINASQIYDFCTSFDGKILYVIQQDFASGDYFLSISYDKGVTFTEKIIHSFSSPDIIFDIKTDHNGNLIIFDKNTLLISSDQGSTWQNLSPDLPALKTINDVQVSFDNYIYLATTGMGILKYKTQLSKPRELTVRVFEDLNKNCLSDNNENSVKNVKVSLNGNYVVKVDENGEAKFLVYNDMNLVSVIFNENIYENCENIYEVNFDSNTPVKHLDIPLQTKKYCSDLKPGISTPFLRRCFDNTYYGSVCNEGNIDANDVKIIIKLDEFFDFVSVNYPIVSQTDAELILDGGTIPSGKCKNFGLTVKLNCDAGLGKEHCIEMDAETSSQNCNGVDSNEKYTDCQPNIGSFDPNDKAIFVNGVRNQEYLEPGDKLEYMIRFQNTGTDTAFTVKIEDPISSKFEISSIRPVAASHDYKWSVENGTLIVVFNNIMLVDSFKNEPNSHGFIKFEITLDKETKLNEEVSNTAGIFFDFNEPVITNKVATAVGKPLGSIEQHVMPFIIFPNPSGDFVTIQESNIKLKNASLVLYNDLGEQIFSKVVNDEFIKLDIGFLNSGIYILTINANGKMYQTKLVKS